MAVHHAYQEALRRAARDAVNVQNASNLPAVLATWTRHCNLIRDVVGNNCTREFFTHPINVMFLSKVASLMSVNADCLGGVDGHLPDSKEISNLFTPSYAWCQEHSREE